jgi:hypothetical protein
VTTPVPEPIEGRLVDWQVAQESVDEAVPWWVRFPERLAYEEHALQVAGIPSRRDDVSFAAGIARLIVSPKVDGEPVDLLVTFPDIYPYFRFIVEAPRTLGLRHHQAGLGRGALCLLERATERWRLTDTVAGLLQTELPRVLAAGRAGDPDAVADVEAQQAEPFSEWYPYVPAMLQIDGAWRIPDEATEGTFSVAIWRGISADGGIPIVHGALCEIRDQHNQVVARADSRLIEAHGPPAFEGRWTRALMPIVEEEPAALFAAAARLELKGREPRWNEVGQAGTPARIQIRGVLFPEEHRWRDASGQGWVFVVRGQAGRATAPVLANSKFLPKKPAGNFAAQISRGRERYAITRAGRGGPTDLRRRIPELTAVKSSRITIVGLGCIGAPSAMEFARAQVAELRVMDGDIVDPATVARWPLGLTVAGQAKATIIAEWIRRDYPYTRVTAEPRVLGAARAGPGSFLDTAEKPQPDRTLNGHPPDHSNGVENDSDYQALARLTAGASLLYDASAEFGVQYFLSEYARAHRLPYIAVSGTQGGWGGRIIRVRPGVTEGCWACMQAARNDGSLPEPPADPNGELLVEGCADPTFTAANFDMTTIAMHGVRLAISTLAGGIPGGYPGVSWDVAIIALRNEAGLLIDPSVRTFPLPRHRECPACSTRT